MKLHQVQAHVANLISASPALAAFGVPFTHSHFTDDETARSQIAERLRTSGVCIEVGSVEADRADDKSHRGVAADAAFDVFVAEAPKVAHTPEQEDLRREVIEAVSAIVDAYTPRAEFLRSDTAINEQGYVLYVISFTIRVTIP